MKKVTILILMIFLFTLVGCFGGDQDTSTSTSISSTEDDQSDIIELDESGLMDSIQCKTFQDAYDTRYPNQKKHIMPSIGNVHALVIPLYFTDGFRLVGDELSTIEKAFFGKSEDTLWESLSSFYKKSSYGKLNIEGTVLDWSNVGSSESYNGLAGATDLDNVAKGLFSSIFVNEKIGIFDSNNDKYFDAIYFVTNLTVNYEMVNSYARWAWKYDYQGELKYKSLGISQYVWMPYDFFTHDDLGNSLEGINASALIHETGHLLGSDDYYDYLPGQGFDSGIGMDDMMANNFGDHNALNKILYGWITPKICYAKTHEINLRSFSDYGDCVIVCTDFDYKKNIFTEFFIIDFYTYKGLDGDNPVRLKVEGETVGFKSNGIRIYHVNATIKNINRGNTYISVFTYDNSDTAYGMINLVSNKLSKNPESNRRLELVDGSHIANADDLFYENDIYVPGNSTGYLNKDILNFEVKVLKIDNDQNSTIQITIK